MRRLPLALLLVLVFASPAGACIWDRDTLRMEQRQFPDALELIAGKFLRHSRAYYEWRIRDREAKLAKNPEDPAIYDDLAVAYEKTGDPLKAVSLMERKAAKWADVYETEANLGTFYVHAGNLEKGLVHIKRAIAINPDAHFGREIYQQLLIEYVLDRRKDGEMRLPLGPAASKRDGKRFHHFVLARRAKKFGKGTNRTKQDEVQAAVKGVLGMMRFGNHASPVLLEALGDLMGLNRYDEDGAKRLAARAYLRAAQVTEGETRTAYRALAKDILAIQTTAAGTTRSLDLPSVERSLQKELAEGRAFVDEVHQKEAVWIKNEKDPEQKFEETYYGREPAVESSSEGGFELPRWLIILGVLLVLNTIMLTATRKRRAPKRRTYGRRR